MPGHDKFGPDGDGPKKNDTGIPTPRRRKTVGPTRKTDRPVRGGGGRRNMGRVCPFRDNGE